MFREHLIPDKDMYTFCNELQSTTLLTSQTINCIKADLLKRGLDPTKWIGKRYQEYLDLPYEPDISRLEYKLLREDTNEVISVKIPTPVQKGTETVWITWNEIPIILRCDLNADWPQFETNQELSRLNVPQDFISFINACEIRNESAVRFFCEFDGLAVISRNETPLEHKANVPWQRFWKEEGGERVSDTFRLKKHNTMVTKYFHSGGDALFLMNIETKKPIELYLTQDPFAPWMQYEVCTRMNNGIRSDGLFDVRWNGAIGVYTGTNLSIPSFDVESKGVAIQIRQERCQTVPGNKYFMQFVSSSWWHTKAMFVFTAFKTITLLVRPRRIEDGEEAAIFHHMNYGGLGTGIFLINRDGQYFFSHTVGKWIRNAPAVLNRWNLLVLQYLGTQGIVSIEMHTCPLTTLLTDCKPFAKELLAKQNTQYPIYKDKGDAGYIILGGTCADYPRNWSHQSFTGDIAWIHGFRQHLNESMLQKEILQSWGTRWYC